MNTTALEVKSSPLVLFSFPRLSSLYSSSTGAVSVRVILPWSSWLDSPIPSTTQKKKKNSSYRVFCVVHSFHGASEERKTIPVFDKLFCFQQGNVVEFSVSPGKEVQVFDRITFCLQVCVSVNNQLLCQTVSPQFGFINLVTLP